MSLAEGMHGSWKPDHRRGGAEAEGITLHTGQIVRVRLCPAAADAGVYFVRTDLPGTPRVAVGPQTVNHAALRRRTELVSAEGVTVATPEHLLAAAFGLGLDNVRVELSGPELPIFDAACCRSSS